MAHMLIVGQDGRTKLVHYHLEGDVCRVDEMPAEEHELSWRLLGLVSIAAVSIAGWMVVLMALRHLLH